VQRDRINQNRRSHSRALRGAGVAILVAIFTLACTSCGTTVRTSLRPEPPPLPAPEIRIGERNGPVVARSPSETARALSEWAGTDPVRLVRAADIVLRQALSRPIADTPAAAGFALESARLAWLALRESGVRAERWLTDPGTSRAVTTYNRAVKSFIEAKEAQIAVGTVGSVPTPAGRVAVQVRFPRRTGAGFFDELLPSERIAIHGMRDRVVVQGLGVALVGQRRRTPERLAEMELFPQCGITKALTAVLDFDRAGSGQATLRLIDPVTSDRWRVGDGFVPLSADFTAPLAFSLGGVNDLLLGIRSFLDVAVGRENSGIYLTEPFDPERTPVLLIHGLTSSPIVWRNVVNACLRYPKIRREFQFLYAYYSTGAPIMVSASGIKEDILKIRAAHAANRPSPGVDRLDLVGYSMGGVISRILVTDIGDRLWNQISRVPFAQVPFDPEDVPILKADLFWTPVPGVRKVIFIATPHRGTRTADASYARLASALVRIPTDFVVFQHRFLEALGDGFTGDSSVQYKLTGLNGLSADSALFRAFEGVPFEKGVRAYSIIGDRGRGDSPESSDGIVGYWSSHLREAESELIVPTGHDAQASPLSEAEIARILSQGAAADRR